MAYVHSKKLTLVLIFALYVAVNSIIIGLISNPALPLTELQFGFGPEVQRILSGQPMENAARLPFVPYFLVAISFISEEQLLALLVKNLLVQFLLAFVLYQWWRRQGLQPYTTVLIAFVLVFPQLVRHGFSLIPEEGYLIALLAFVFHGILEAPRNQNLPVFIPYAIASGVLFLTKGTMLTLAPVVCVLFFYRTRRPGVLALFMIFVGAAMLMWGTTTLNSTGRFSLTTMYTGYEIWKGNNPRTLEFFPRYTLDALSAEAPRRLEGESQWEWSRRCRNEAVDFVTSEPAVAGKLLLLRLYQVFIAVSAEESASWSSNRFGQVRPYLKVIGIFFMIAFRLLFLATLIYAIAAVTNSPKGSDRCTAATSYLLFVAAFSFPFLVAWGTERRVVPIVIPVVLYALYVLQHDHRLRVRLERFRRRA